MDATLRLARQHCAALLAENEALDHNVAVLWGLVACLQELGTLEGHDLGVLPLTPDLPPQVISDTIHALGQRLQKFRDAQPKPETNGHASRVPVGAGKGEPDAT